MLSVAPGTPCGLAPSLLSAALRAIAWSGSAEECWVKLGMSSHSMRARADGESHACVARRFVGAPMLQGSAMHLRFDESFAHPAHAGGVAQSDEHIERPTEKQCLLGGCIALLFVGRALDGASELGPVAEHLCGPNDLSEWAVIGWQWQRTWKSLLHRMRGPALGQNVVICDWLAPACRLQSGGSFASDAAFLSTLDNRLRWDACFWKVGAPLQTVGEFSSGVVQVQPLVLSQWHLIWGPSPTAFARVPRAAGWSDHFLQALEDTSSNDSEQEASDDESSTEPSSDSSSADEFGEGAAPADVAALAGVARPPAVDAAPAGVPEAGDGIDVAGFGSDGGLQRAAAVPPPPPPAPAAARERAEPRGNDTFDCDVTLIVPGLGKITHYHKKMDFYAICDCAHERCVKVRASRSAAATKRLSQGRPLGYLMAWLRVGPNFVDSHDHKFEAWATGKPTLAERQAAREALCELPGAEALLARERPRRPGEEDEPAGDV